MAIINLTNVLKPFVGQVVGYVQVNKTWVHHNNTYECAAWWEDSEIVAGKYPLFLKQKYLSPKELILECVFDAIVVDAYFPSMSGGVAFSNKGSKERIGGLRNIHHSFDIVEVMERTGNIPGDKEDFFLNPLLWDAFIEAARKSMVDYQSYLENCFSAYIQEGDGNFCSNVSSIQYASKNVSDLANALQRMKRAKANVDNISDYMSEVYSKNISWVIAA